MFLDAQTEGHILDAWLLQCRST